jgi:integrase/recombinase XerD
MCATFSPTVRAVPYSAFCVDVAPLGRHWTVVDDRYERHELADAFSDHMQFGRDRAELTVKAYAGDLAAYLTWAERRGENLLEAARSLAKFVTHQRVTPIAAGRRGQGRPRSPACINRMLAAVREFYKWAVANGHISSAVLPLLYEVVDDRFLPASLKPEGGGLAYHARPRHGLRAERGKRPDCATDEEVAALLRACRSWRDRFLVYLLFSTGLRRGAVGGLRRSDLHFADSSTELGCTIAGAHLHVRRRQNVNKATSKSRADFHVPVDHHALALYERYLNERDDCPAAEHCDFVFVNLFAEPLGQPMAVSSLGELLTRLSQRAGLARDVHPHMFRHALATNMADHGVNLDVLSALLGHSSLRSTELYLHPSDRLMREAVLSETRRRTERHSPGSLT